jgi:hypothetical protein
LLQYILIFHTTLSCGKKYLKLLVDQSPDYLLIQHCGMSTTALFQVAKQATILRLGDKLL